MWGGREGRVKGATSLSQNRDSYFDTHTVDFNSPGPMDIVGSFLIMCSIFLWCERKTQTVTLNKKKRKKKKGLQDNYFLGYVFRMPTCLDVSQDN